MIDLNYINSYFPSQIASNAAFQKHILKGKHSRKYVRR